MIETSRKTEYSEELRALALRFFSFNDEFYVKRTEEFMELSGKVRDMHDDIKGLLKVMRTGKPFKTIVSEKGNYGIHGSYGNPITTARKKINEYSMESIFNTVLSRAMNYDKWGSKWSSHGYFPHAEAMAWIAYFTAWDSDEDKYVPNKHWIKYYNDHYVAAQ